MAARPKILAPKVEGPVLRCVFFRTEAGNEPVREWLRDHVTAEARKTIGEDILGEEEMNEHEGSTLESLFEELGELEEVEARAAKRVLAIQAERRMKELGLSTTALASRMRTSRNQVHRILDGQDAGITLKMLFRLAQALEVPLVVELGSVRKPMVPPSTRPARAAKSARSRSTPAAVEPARSRRRPIAAE